MEREKTKFGLIRGAFGHSELPSRKAIPLRREAISAGKKALSQEQRARTKGVENDAKLKEAVERHDRNITAITYKEEPFVYGLFEAYKELNSLNYREQMLARKGILQRQTDSEPIADNIWEVKFRGTSLSDIENMETDSKTHELSPDDIQKLNRMFRTGGVFAFNKHKSHDFINQYLIYLAPQNHIRPENGPPGSIKKLQENMQSYFDYYTDFLTDFDRDPSNESQMLLMLTLGNPILATALGTYAPAKLNITPSSSVKLFQQRESSAKLGDNLGWKSMRKHYMRAANAAYRKNALPEDLEKYQHYDPEADSKSEAILKDYIGNQNSPDEQIEMREKSKKIMEDYSLHKKDLIRDIMQSKDKRLEYQISEDHPSENVTLVRNRETLVFVMKFPGETHLILEVDKEGRLFGIPPGLLKAYPHIGDNIKYDLLFPVLKKYRVEENVVEDEDKPLIINDLSPVIIDSIPIVDENESEIEERFEEVKPPKRKRLEKKITSIMEDPLPPKTPEKPIPFRFVPHTENEVKQYLGGKLAKQQNVVDQVLRTINSFQLGHIDGRIVRGRHSEVNGNSVVRIRSGKYRVLLERIGGGNYKLLGIVHKQEVDRASGY